MNRSHTVDINGLLGGARQTMLVDDQVPIQPFEGATFPEPARVHLELRYVDRLLHIEGTADARVHGECDKCLDDVERDVHADIDERIDPDHNRDDDPFGESNVLVNGRLDIADLAQQVLLSEMPMGIRCKEDCAGLCGTCGTNLNAGECSCDNGDSRGKSEVEDPA